MAKSEALRNVPQKTLNTLKDEYFKLIRGSVISVPLKVQFNIPVKISWQEDIHGCFNYDESFYRKMEQYVYNQADKLSEQKSKKKLERLNTLIQRFMLKTKTTATKYEVTDDDIWDYLWDQQAKAGL